MLSIDGVIPSRENAVAQLDVRLLQREHGFAQREASVHVVRHYAIEKGKRGNASSRGRFANLSRGGSPRQRNS